MPRLTKRYEQNNSIAYTYGDSFAEGFLAIGAPITKLGMLEDVTEDIVDYTDGEVNGQPTIIITFKQSDILLKLLEELEDDKNKK